MELCDYENDLKLMRRNVLYRGVSPLSEIKSDSLKAGITLQFKEINVLGIIPNNLNGKMKEKQTRMIKSKKNKFEPTKTLNEMKISLTYMEWYMKSSKAKGELRDESIEQQQIGDIRRDWSNFGAYLCGGGRDSNQGNFSVSPDIFLEGSSLMKWWKEYEACKENLHASDFAKDEVQNRRALHRSDSPPAIGFDMSISRPYLGGFWFLIEACSVASKGENMSQSRGFSFLLFRKMPLLIHSFVSEDKNGVDI
ncbi:hypothetical protein Tco_1145429 [Tanacetum coccineum]